MVGAMIWYRPPAHLLWDHAEAAGLTLGVYEIPLKGKRLLFLDGCDAPREVELVEPEVGDGGGLQC